MSDEDMAGKLKRPVANVRKYRQRMNLKKVGGRGNTGLVKNVRQEFRQKTSSDQDG